MPAQPDIFEEIVRLRAAETPAALATVVDTKGSTPGKLGARMIIHADGSIVGTIGGGCVEADVIRTARSVLDTGRSEKMQFTLAGEDAGPRRSLAGGELCRQAEQGRLAAPLRCLRRPRPARRRAMLRIQKRGPGPRGGRRCFAYSAHSCATTIGHGSHARHPA